MILRGLWPIYPVTTLIPTASNAVLPVVLLLAITGGCKEAVSQSPSVSLPLANDARPTPDGHDPNPNQHRYRTLLCGQEPSCCIRHVWGAGSDKRGQLLRVVALGRGDCSAGYADETASADDPSDSCERYWLVTQLSDAPPSRHWIGEACRGDKSELSTAVDPLTRSFSYGEQSLFSNERSSSVVTIGLDPLRVVATSTMTLSPSHGHTESWNFDEFAGLVQDSLDYCPGQNPAGTEATKDRDAAPIETLAVAIPRVELPEEFLADGWREVSLGRCAARIDGVTNGFTIARVRAAASDASVRVVLSEANDLFVEVEDDQLARGDAHRIRDDVLEIWVARTRDCIDPSAPSPAKQWRIGIRDGRSSSGEGSPPPLTAQSERRGNQVRLRIALASALAPEDRFGIVYDRSGGLGESRRRIATCPFESGKWWTLGRAYQPSSAVRVSKHDLACGIESATLVPRVPSLPPAPEHTRALAP